MVDSWRRYKRDLTEEQDRRPRPGLLRPSQVSQADLIIPASHYRLRLFFACLFCGAGLAVLWVYFPLLLVSIALNRDFGPWKWSAPGGFAAIAAVVIYLYAAADEQRYWDSL